MTRFGDTTTLPSQACGCEQLTSDQVWGRGSGTRLRYRRKLVAVRNLPTTRFGGTTTLPSQACGFEQLTSDEVWRHDSVTIASLWLRASYQRRGLGTRLRYHRKLVAVSKLTATSFEDTTTLPSHHRKLVAVSNLITSDEVRGHDYVTIASLCL